MKRFKILNFLILLNCFYGLFASRSTMLRPLAKSFSPYTGVSEGSRPQEKNGQNSLERSRASKSNKSFYSSKIPSYEQRSIMQESQSPHNVQQSHTISPESSKQKVNVEKVLNNPNSIYFSEKQPAASSIYGFPLLDWANLEQPLNVSLQSNLKSNSQPFSASNFIYRDQNMFQQTYPMYRPLFDSSIPIDQTSSIRQVLGNQQSQKSFSLLDLVKDESSYPATKLSKSFESSTLPMNLFVLDNRLENVSGLSKDSNILVSKLGELKQNLVVTPQQQSISDQMNVAYNDGSVINILQNQNVGPIFSFVNISKNLGLRYIVGKNPIIELGFKDLQGKDSIITITDPTVLISENQALLQALPSNVQKELPILMETKAVQDILMISMLPFDQLQSLEKSLNLVLLESETSSVNNNKKLVDISSDKIIKDDLFIETQDENLSLDHETIQNKPISQEIPIVVDKEIQEFAQKEFDSLPKNSSRFSRILAMLQKMQERIIAFIQSIGAYDEAAYQRNLLAQLKTKMAVDLAVNNIDKSTWLAKIEMFIREVWQILNSKNQENKNSINLSEM